MRSYPSLRIYRQFIVAATRRGKDIFFISVAIGKLPIVLQITLIKHTGKDISNYRNPSMCKTKYVTQSIKANHNSSTYM